MPLIEIKAKNRALPLLERIVRIHSLFSPNAFNRTLCFRLATQDSPDLWGKQQKQQAGGAVQKGRQAPLKVFKTPLMKRTYSYETVRDDYQDSAKSWTNERDDELTIMHGDGVSIAEIADHFGCTKGAVKSRIKKLGLE